MMDAGNDDDRRTPCARSSPKTCESMWTRWRPNIFLPDEGTFDFAVALHSRRERLLRMHRQRRRRGRRAHGIRPQPSGGPGLARQFLCLSPSDCVGITGGFRSRKTPAGIMEDLGRLMRGDMWDGSPTSLTSWAAICPTPKPNTTTPTAACNDFKTNCPPSPMPPPPCLQSLSFPHFLRIVDQPPAGPGSALFPKAPISRHPGESRDPVCEIVADIRFKPWIPAFAGMTEIGENCSVETGGLWSFWAC
jgi:hypothetical protein